jgi:LPS-assembly protein
MRVGQRLDLAPKIAYPFQIAKKFDFMPQVLYRETQYRFNPPESAEHPAGNAEGFSPTAARRYVQADMGMKTEFSRVYGSLSDTKAIRWKHIIEPELNYSQILFSRRPNHPFFGELTGGQWNRQYEPLTDAELNSANNKVQFDYNDRTYEKQVLDLAINNRLMRKLWLNGAPDYENKVIFRVSQSYDFNEARSTTPHPWSSINGLLNMRFDHFETYTTAAYWPYANVTDVTSRLRTMATAQNFVQFSYTRSYALTEESVVSGRPTSNYGFAAGLLSRYVEGQGGIDFDANSGRMQQWSYAAILKPPGRCWTITLDHRQIVGGDRQIHASLNFDFGGGPPPLPATATTANTASPSSSSTTTIIPSTN